MDLEVVEQARYLGSDARCGGIECGNGCCEVAVLTFQLVEFVEEFSRSAHRAEDAVLCSLDVPIEVGDKPVQPRHRC